MTNHHDEMKVAPDPARAEELRRLLHAHLGGDRIGAMMANPPSADVSVGEATAITIEPEAEDSQRLPARHNTRRMFRAAVVLAAASVVAFAVVATRNRTPREDPYVYQGGPQPNGWVAFTDGESSSVYLVREGESPRRVAGAESDASAQVCPAFSPDGGRLVFGQATETRSSPSGYGDDSELVIIEVAADGSTSGTTTIPVEGLTAPPCPMWSPDGRWVAFGAGNEVRLVDTITQELRRLAGYAATDLEWLAGADELAIAADQGIHLYSVATGEVRSLGIEGAGQLAWSPDGTTVAFTRGTRVGSGEAEHDESSLWLVDADGTNERRVADAIRANHGIGPVWSPDGRYIAYQRLIPGYGEAHEVVLVSAIAGDSDNPIGTETVIAPPTTPGPDRPLSWYPWSVTWSPDGSMLLYTAWNDACHQPPSEDCDLETGHNRILAVPIDTTSPPIVLVDSSWSIDHHPGLQSWGRQPVS